MFKLRDDYTIIAMNEKGVTLIELIIVVSVISVLVVALGFSFQGWMGSYNMEQQMKNMYADLMNARTRALQRNRIHFVSMTTNNYTIQEDISPWPDGDGLLTGSDNTRPSGYSDPIPLSVKNIDPRCPIVWSSPGDPLPQMQFTKKGLANAARTICINAKTDTDYNCISLSQSRINLGKLTTKITDGGACNATNCVPK